MPSVKLSPLFNDAQLDNNGLPLSGGMIYWYLAGTTTPVIVYSESSGSVANTNPVILNTRGEPIQPIWLPTGSTYKAVLNDSLGNLIRTVDNISGVNDTTTPVISEWVLYAGAATYISGTSFSVTGDATATFDNNRRVKATVSGTDRYGTVNGAPVYAMGVTTVTLTLDSGVLDSSLATVYYGFLDPAHPSFDTTGVNNNTKAGVQSQTWVAFTTGGTSGTYTLTPNPAITAYAAGQRFNVTFNAASATTNTINVSALGAKSLKMYDSSGTKINAVFALNQVADIIYDGTDFVVANIAQDRQIQPITASVGSSALTCTLNPTSLDFRSTPLTSGTINTRTVGASISLVVPSTATLGTVSAQQSRLILLALDNAGTIELAVVNIAGGNNLDETTLISTTALSITSDSANVVYSTTARTSLPFRVVGYVDSTQAVAGTWVTAPSTIQGSGGQALTALSSIGYGQIWSNPTRASGTTYTNSTGKPIMVCIAITYSATSSQSSSITVGGVTIQSSGGNNVSGAYSTPIHTFIVPNGSTYVASIGGSLRNWAELS
jgi:hypothetical protein